MLYLHGMPLAVQIFVCGNINVNWLIKVIMLRRSQTVKVPTHSTTTPHVACQVTNVDFCCVAGTANYRKTSWQNRCQFLPTLCPSVCILCHSLKGIFCFTLQIVWCYVFVLWKKFPLLFKRCSLIVFVEIFLVLSRPAVTFPGQITEAYSWVQFSSVIFRAA